MYKLILKRILDIILGIIAFTILLPVFLIVTLLLFWNNKGLPFFIQTRPGLNGSLFGIIKFKTMTDAKTLDGMLLPDAERLTKLGSFIRMTSMDEIPQLLNVINGDMSLIGPRPLLPEYIPLYNPYQSRRHLVKPGITGWAQVNGRNAISWEQKFDYDVWYVDNISFALDCKILWMTVRKVFIREGISGTDSVTMEKFTGKV